MDTLLQNLFATGFGTATLFIIGFLIFNAILWTFLPFAIFGIKKRLDLQIKLLTAIANGESVKNDVAKPMPKDLKYLIYFSILVFFCLIFQFFIAAIIF